MGRNTLLSIVSLTLGLTDFGCAAPTEEPTETTPQSAEVTTNVDDATDDVSDEEMEARGFKKKSRCHSNDGWGWFWERCGWPWERNGCDSCGDHKDKGCDSCGDHRSKGCDSCGKGCDSCGDDDHKDRARD